VLKNAVNQGFFAISINGILISTKKVQTQNIYYMDTKTKDTKAKKTKKGQATKSKPEFIQNTNFDTDLNELEGEGIIEDEEELERKQLLEEQRDREIEKSYEEEDESNKKSWARFKQFEFSR
jgi:hypothetical protein